MWVDILLAVVALAGVTYGIAGDPRKDGKLTNTGKGVVLVAAIALLLSIIKSVNDENERVELKSRLATVQSNTDLIPGLFAKIDRLEKENENILKTTAIAASETAQLKSEILAEFKSIRKENELLIRNIPDSIVIRKEICGKMFRQSVPVDKQRVVKEVQKFQSEMDRLQQQLLLKVDQIESLFKSITEAAESSR